MAFPKYTVKVHDRKFNYFAKSAVNWTQFGALDGYTVADGYGCDQFIPFSTFGVIFNIEGTGTSAVEYSFDGYHVHE
jgi:hypothetical protein